MRKLRHVHCSITRCSVTEPAAFPCPLDACKRKRLFTSDGPCRFCCRAGSEVDDVPAQASRASSVMSKDSGSRKLKTYSGMLDSYAQSSRR